MSDQQTPDSTGRLGWALATVGCTGALAAALLSPTHVHTARNRGEGEAPLLYGCLFLSNAGSLLLPGSNLTNLIVLGHLRLLGGQFLRHMAPAAIAAALVTGTGGGRRRTSFASHDGNPGIRS